MYYMNVARGVRLAVYDLNPSGKKTVFLIHGWPLNHRMFEYQLDVLPKLGFRCVSVDLRGFGNSDAPWSGYTYDAMADDLYTVIRSLNTPEIALAGFSMGGAVAIRYMVRHHGFRVARLALLAAAAPSFTRRPDFPYGMTQEAVNALIAQAFRNRPQMTEDFGKIFFASKVTPAFAGWFNRLSDAAAGHSTIQALETLRDADLRGDLARIRVPTGIFHGVLDQICPFDFALAMQQEIKNAQLFRFERSGHAVFYDELDRFNREFADYLGGGK